MKKKYELEFCFKGSRKYVQGPDIFDAVLEKIKEEFSLDKLSDVKYAAHEMLLSNATLSIVDNFNKNDFNTINSLITFMYNNIKYYAVVYTNNVEIQKSTEYSEELVRTSSKLNGKSIEFLNTSADSLTEIIVSMNKFYLQEVVTKDGKWIVTKFEYINLVNYFNIKGKLLKLELQSNFNNKLTKSKILVDDILVGYIYFSLV